MRDEWILKMNGKNWEEQTIKENWNKFDATILFELEIILNNIWLEECFCHTKKRNEIVFFRSLRDNITHIYIYRYNKTGI